MGFRLVLAIGLFWSSLAYSAVVLEPPVSGSFCSESDPDFLEFRYSESVPICERNVESSTKAEIYEKYNIPAKDRKDYTIDHFIPLSLGGSNHLDNLWPQHKSIDQVGTEYKLYKAVSEDRMPCSDAVSFLSLLKKYLHIVK
jgi:hypothetical protein